jgi:ornithine cyclodeaminase
MEVARLLPPADVLARIKGAFLDRLVAPPRIAGECLEEDGQTRTMLVMPALRRGGLATVKVVNVARGMANQLSSHLLAFGPKGEMLAIVEAHQLTARRTAAASVLAAQTLGKGEARHLAVIGAGRQARAQVRAFADAMPLETVTIWARRDSAAQELAEFCATTGATVTVAPDPEEAVRDADIVTCVMASETPLVMGSFLRPGVHVDLVGGFRPTMREADDALMARATVVADTPAALNEAGDLLQPIVNCTIQADHVLLLSDLLDRTASRRACDLTVFKSVGHAAEDLVITELLLERLGLIAGQSASPAQEPRT